MRNKKPPFEITNSILDRVAEIAEMVGHVNAMQDQHNNLMLRRANRIKTIHSSLAIEQNTLSLEQVTAILSGKRLIAPPKDIAEVKNAYEIYEMLDSLNPYSVKDLLKAHGVMTKGLIDEAGCFRSGSVGVVDKKGKILHFGTLPAYVPQLVTELLDWVRDSDFHMLIKSCVFHYELELIHPFADGNGRIGRLWNTLLLSQWKPLFAWLPVESIIYNRQNEYYAAINRSNGEAESTAFIEFMLFAIQEALTEAIEISGKCTDSKKERWQQIEIFLNQNGVIANADIREMFQVSAATANRILAKLTEEGKIQRIRVGKFWGYRLFE